MKRLKTLGFFLLTLFSINFAMAACTQKQKSDSKIDKIAAEGYKHDSFKTVNQSDVDLVFIKHGSLMVDINDYLVYIDPVTMFGNDFTKVPKADMILVTHEHHDHYDKSAIESLSSPETRLIMSREVTAKNGSGEAIVPGQSIEMTGLPTDFTLMAVPAYNNSSDHLQFHPKEREDVGFIFDVDGLRIYVAGDTEDISDMTGFKDIDVAFLPVNQPFTMTSEQAIHAVDMLVSARSQKRPGKLVVYPYHYGNTDLTPLVEHFANSPAVEIRVREMQ